MHVLFIFSICTTQSNDMMGAGAMKVLPVVIILGHKVLKV